MPPSEGLQHVLTKSRWAQHQIALLDLSVSDYVNAKPYVSIIEDDPEAHEYRINANLRYPPPDTISLIAGDVLNNLQGVLDHIAWQLVLREKEVPGRKTYFPIKSSNNDGTKPAINVLDIRGKPAIKDPAILKILENAQPYNNALGDQAVHPLIVLRTSMARASTGTSPFWPPRPRRHRSTLPDTTRSPFMIRVTGQATAMKSRACGTSG